VPAPAQAMEVVPTHLRAVAVEVDPNLVPGAAPEAPRYPFAAVTIGCADAGGLTGGFSPTWRRPATAPPPIP